MNVHSARTPRVFGLAATAIVIAATSIGVVGGHERDERDDRGRGPASYTIGLFGDMPYNDLGRAQYPNLIADINASHLEFSIFDDDLKAGGDGPCSNELYTTAIHN